MKSRSIVSFVLMVFSVFACSFAFAASTNHPQTLKEALASTYTVVYQNNHGVTNGFGSGWLIDVEEFELTGCYVVTNSHVISRLSKQKKLQVARIYVQQFLELNGNQWSETMAAEIVYTDPKGDIGILKIPSCDGVKPFKLKTVGVESGLLVHALGSPSGLHQTVTSGVVSFNKRYYVKGQSYIQTDAPINPGNSGGPLVDRKTFEVIGMNTMILGRSTKLEVTTDGLGLSVRAATIRQAFHNMIQLGHPSYPSLGFLFSPTTSDTLLIHNYPRSLSQVEGCRGIMVGEVVEGNGAEQAGLLVDDIVVKINGECVNGLNSLFSVLNASSTHKPFKLMVWRSSENRVVNLSIEAQEKYEPIGSERIDGAEPARVYNGLLGFEISNDTDFPTDKPVVVKVYEYSEAFWQNMLLGYRTPPIDQDSLPVIPTVPRRIPMKPPVVMNVLENPSSFIHLEDGKRRKSFQYIESVRDTSGRTLSNVTQESLERFALEAKNAGAKLVFKMRFVVLKSNYTGTAWQEDEEMSNTRLVFFNPTAYQSPE